VRTESADREREREREGGRRRRRRRKGKHVGPDRINGLPLAIFRYLGLGVGADPAGLEG
jgi:hypothetical protein